MTKAELKHNTLEFVKRMLPEAKEADIERATAKIIWNLAYLTEDYTISRRLPRPRRG